MSFNYQAAVNINATFTGKSGTDQAARAIDNVSKSVNGLGSKFKEIISGGIKDLAAAFAVKQLVNYGKSIIDLGDHLNDLRQKTGIGVNALSSLKTAAELGGQNFEAFEKNLKKFSVTAAEAGAGVLKSKSGFDALGISVKDSHGNIKSADKLLFEVSDKFENLKDGPEKAAIAVRLFGKSGADLIPVLNDGSKALSDYGLKIGDDFAKKADAFNDSTTLIKKNIDQVSVNIVSDLLPALNDVGKALVNYTKATEGSVPGTSAISVTIRGIASAFVLVTERAGAFIDIFKAGLAEMTAIIAQFGKQFVDFALLFGRVAETKITDFGGLKKAFKSFKEDASSDFKDFANISKTIGADLSTNLSKRFKDTGKAFSEIFNGVEQVKEETKPKPKVKADLSSLNTGEESKRDQQLKALDKYIEKQKESIELKLLEMQKVDMTETAYKKLTEQKKLEAEAARETVGWEKETKDAYDAATQAFIAQKNALIDLEEQQKQSFGQGAKEAVYEYAETIRNVAAQSKNLFLTAFRGIEDALVNFVKTGKLSFADLAAAIQTELIRIAVRQAVIAPLLGLVGSAFGGGAAAVSSGGSAGVGSFGGLGFGGKFANGGIMTSEGPVPLKKYANGGIANSPQMALFGEGASPEAYVPLPDGRRIPVAMQGQGSGGGNISITTIVNADGTSKTSGEGDSKSKDLAALVSGQVKQIIIQEKRPGGLLA